MAVRKPATVHDLRGEAEASMRKHVDARLLGLRIERYSWWVHWRELADYILPRRYKWLITPNQAARGSPLNQHIIDSTGTVAARICAAGMTAGITSPSRPWFRLTIPDFDEADTSPVKLWLDIVQTRMMRILAQSNYYTAKATQFFDLVVFGTAPMIIYEDRDEIVRCYNPCAGEYYAASSNRLVVDTLYREFVMTIPQMVNEFGLEACSNDVQQAFKQGGAPLIREKIIGHGMEPNDTRLGGSIVPSHFPWREVYWEYGGAGGKVLRAKGFRECPFSCPRWDVVSNDPYGRSPAMDALGDIRQLQIEQKRKAQAIDKMVNPPLLADVTLKNQPASTLPGGITYVSGIGPEKGMRPVYEVMPRLEEMQTDIKECQQRIGRVFFNDLFQMISSLETVRTATEIDRRQEEKLIQLGPVYERNQNESQDPDIERIFAISARRGLFPPAPREIHGMPIQVNYVSMLAEAQRAASTAALERLAGFIGSLAALDPQAADNMDFDEMIDEYADRIGASPKVIRATAQVAALRQQRAQQQAQQQALQTSMAGVQGAKVLSETDTGAGQNALSAILGNQPSQQAA